MVGWFSPEKGQYDLGQAESIPRQGFLVYGLRVNNRHELVVGDPLPDRCSLPTVEELIVDWVYLIPVVGELGRHG